MAEFFLELFSEEMPSGLQKNAREEILKIFTQTFYNLNINFKLGKSYSIPKRLVFFFQGIPEKIELKSKTIRGPKIEAPEKALEGFLKSNNLKRSNIFEQKTEKGTFFFAILCILAVFLIIPLNIFINFIYF